MEEFRLMKLGIGEVAFRILSFHLLSFERYVSIYKDISDSHSTQNGEYFSIFEGL
jgi:hypothetical protein